MGAECAKAVDHGRWLSKEQTGTWNTNPFWIGKSDGHW
jgi:hypothetical protein